jgi:hypothetical protein
MRVKLANLFVVLVALLAVAPASSQTDNGFRLRGVVVSFDADSLVVKTDDGNETGVTLTPETLITANRPTDLGAVKPGDFVASAAVRGTDGKLHSTELRIFPEALRGTGEGQRPMSDPGKTMTNAEVAEVTGPVEGRVVKVKFKGGSDQLVVGPDVPVIEVVVSGPESLVPGLKVFVLATKIANGALIARRILAM